MPEPTLLENLQGLDLSIKNISSMTGIPEGRLYKWSRGIGNPKVADHEKLKEVWERLRPQPTNDTYKNLQQNLLNIAAEEQAPYGIPKVDLIISLKKQIEDLRADKRRLIAEIDSLKQKIDNITNNGK